MADLNLRNFPDGLRRELKAIALRENGTLRGIVIGRLEQVILESGKYSEEFQRYIDETMVDDEPAPIEEPKPEREPMVFKPRSAGASDLAVGPGDICAMPGAKPGLAELRALESSIKAKPVAMILEAAAPHVPCPATAPYGDTGEWFACSLHAGHKGSHNRGAKVEPPDGF